MIRRAAGTTSTTVGVSRHTALTAGTTDGVAIDRTGRTAGTTVTGLARRRPATVTTGTGSRVDSRRRRRIATPAAVTAVSTGTAGDNNPVLEAAGPAGAAGRAVATATTVAPAVGGDSARTALASGPARSSGSPGPRGIEGLGAGLAPCATPAAIPTPAASGGIAPVSAVAHRRQPATATGPTETACPGGPAVPANRALACGHVGADAKLAVGVAAAPATASRAAAPGVAAAATVSAAQGCPTGPAVGAVTAVTTGPAAAAVTVQTKPAVST
jgi:hypothetical protein